MFRKKFSCCCSRVNNCDQMQHAQARCAGASCGHPCPDLAHVEAARLADLYGGLCRAYQSYTKLVAPIFLAAGIEVDLHVTTRQGHCTEIIRTLDLRHIDALVFAGGDGTAYEGLQVSISPLLL